MAPVFVSRVMPDGHVPLTDTVALPVAPRVAGKPFTLSLVVILVIAIPPLASIVPLSVIGSTAPITSILRVVVASQSKADFTV